jgi:prepilin-type N-terminal cleavage/methylation domain-containing protein
MYSKSVLNRKGVTLIELMVALVISGIVIAAIYRLFVAQTRAYTVQDQVVEIQQNVRSAMEVLLRDLRMTGCDDDNTPDKPPLVPIVTPVAANAITVSYRYYDRNLALNRVTVVYTLVGTDLQRQLTVNGVANPAEPILPNINSFILTYGIDADANGVVDDQNGNGFVDPGDYVAFAAVGASRILSIRVQLSANPSPNNPDAVAQVSPRTLDSIVTLRNLL